MRYLGLPTDGSTPAPWSPDAPVPASPWPNPTEARPAQLREYLDVLAKRWRLIASFASGAIVLMGVACLFIQPLYTATAVLHIERDMPQVTGNIQQVAPGPSYLEGLEYFQDQIETLESRALAARTIHELGLENDDSFTERGKKPGVLDRVQGTFWNLYWLVHAKINRLLRGDSPKVATQGRGGDGQFVPEVPPGLIAKYLRGLQVTPVTNTRMIQVKFTSPSPALSQKVANAHALQYIRRGLQAKFQLTGEARQFLQAEIQRVEGELNKAEEASDEFRREHQVVSLDERENAIVERLTDLGRRLTGAQADRIGAEAEYQLVKSRQYDSLPAVISNALIQTLKTDVSRLETQQAELSQTFLPASPQLQEVSSQLRQTRSRLEREIGRVVGGIESVYLATKAKEDALRTEFERQQTAVLDLKAISGQYIKLDQAVTTNRELYKTLLTRMQETDVVKGVPFSNASVLDPAELPRGPSHPQVPFDLAFALIFGLGIGVALAFVLEHLDSSLRTPDDVRHVLRLPTLGVVPDFAYLPRGYGRRYLPALRTRRGGAAAAGERKGEIVSLMPQGSMHAEAYRSIRTSLLFCNPEQPPRSVLVTSSQPGEGKTLTTVNLAISLTQLGNRVIVIDADLRQPRCHRVLGIAASQGLVDVLRGDADVEEVLQRLCLDNSCVTLAGSGREGGPALYILQSGAPPADPSELLASPRMYQMLGSLIERYDMVLVDSPPVFPITDAAILASVVDGVVLVVRGQRTERQVTREALDRLRYMKATVIGVVLNGINPGSSDYYRYPYYFAPEHVA